MAKKQAAKTAKAAPKTATKTAAPKNVLPAHPLRTTVGERKVKQLVTSAPHFKFENKGDTLAFKPTSKIIPLDGEYAGKLIGWNGVNLDTGEQVMVGNTHQIEKAFTMDVDGEELWTGAAGFVITWNGKTGLGNGKTFNNYDIGQIEE